ncbi:PREDICTED: transcription factor MYB1R1 isoform X2 [Tarenaya hassleriana]|uniref:transcription factor MYB1R1 isoform X2 n=1 Tax=Tarenaya hassleriana TaxID=28532 RepID=UPI00053C4C4E|nr:PREDICTED: transcription factor MYB1R1 isoform X2 [Tarenaya hassleriana]
MRGNPWTEEEHMRFLRGLDELGKGDWRAISRNYVVTRTPTQVASHAQKYFLRLNCLNNRRRRGSSLFDITIDSVTISRQEKPMVFPVIGESSQTPIRMFQPPVLRISDLSLNDRPPELFLSLAMPSSPSSSDEPNPVDA